MIYKDCTITISKGVATISEPIILYRGDKEVELCFEIKENLYKYSDGTNIVSSSEASYSQIVIKVPNNKPPIFGEILETKEGKAVLKVTSEMIDEIDEVGLYDFQVRLFDKSKTSRITIPPVEKGIEIREPIAIEDESTTNEVGIAKVGYAQVGTKGVQRPTLNEDGSYNRKFWIDKEPITKEDLNVLEDIVDKNTTQVKESATKKYVDEQCKDIAKDVLLEDGKLYLKKSDGTKLGTGVILPISGSGGSVAWESVTGKPATFTPSSHSHSKSDITDFPTIPTVSNDLTNALKANYDSAYTHSTSAHAPSTAQKNSDITKEEIEAKLTGEISTHSHANSGQSEKKWRLIKEVTLSEDVNSIIIDKDVNNNSFALEELMILGRDVKASNSSQLMVSHSQGGTIVTTLNDFINTTSKSLYVKLSHIGNYFLVQSRSSTYNIFGIAGDRIADRFSNFHILYDINIFVSAGTEILANSKFEIWGR